MEEKIVQIFADNYEVDVNTLSVNSRLYEDLNSTSLVLFSLVAMLEGELGKAPSFSEANQMKTIADFVAYYQ